MVGNNGNPPQTSNFMAKTYCDGHIPLLEKIYEVEGKQEASGKRVDTVEQTIRDEVKPSIDKVHTRIDKLLYWIMGTMGTVLIAIVLLLFNIFKNKL